MENNNKDAESEKVEINDEEIREAKTEELKERKKKKNSNTTNMLSSPEILDENEKSKVDSMRALIQKEDPSFQEIDDLILRRFLRARNLDIEKATNMFLKYLRWRRSFVPNGSISSLEVTNEIAQNKFFIQGQDKKGRPIAVLFGGRHHQAKLDEFKRFAVFCLDKICSRMPRGQEKFVAIGDLQGYGYSNSDIRGYLAALSILQDCYPERLGKIFIVHAPYIFMAAWKIIYPLIDNNTKKKIMFVEDENLKSTLLTDIDESQLPVTYGGKLQLVPIQDC
ncbi:hypothetical protein L484_004671 [Morus notabilis]|uniref:CRAL-TRIO domain-containing protein n=1 Tax=Morus notabilis TaxID=981085 RepID=W9RSB8_9ROSA|nr:sec14 cytosolic factor [Morus notabilis]EXB94145.1 hypothetical protein L484_004671 [Morus notabilis]